MPTKTGTTKATITTMTTSAIAKTTAGYIIADFTWRLRASSFSSWSRDAVERLLEAARALAGAHHRAVERIEDARLALHRLVQRAAGLDVVADGRDRRLQHLVLGLVLQRVERAQHRHAGRDQGRELAREDRQVAHVDALEALEDALELQRLALLGDVEHDQAALAQLLGDLRLGASPPARRGRERPARSTARKVKVLTGSPSSRPWPTGAAPASRAASRCGGLLIVGRPVRRAAEQPPELLRHRRALLGERARDHAGADERGEVRVHRLHPDRARGLQGGVDLVGLALADQVADRGGRDEDLAATTRPAPSAVLRSCWVTMPCSAIESCMRTWCCWCGGEDVDDAVDRLRGRLRVQGREDEVPGLRRGQRGARSSRGRASRRRGSRRGPRGGRRGARAEKSVASAPISRWLTMQLLWRCRNSIGSSIVRMCSARSRLIRSTIDASVVDLPEPVGPVTSTKPRGLRVNSSRTPGQAELAERLDLARDEAEGGADRAALEEAR